MDEVHNERTNERVDPLSSDRTVSGLPAAGQTDRADADGDYVVKVGAGLASLATIHDVC